MLLRRLASWKVQPTVAGRASWVDETDGTVRNRVASMGARRLVRSPAALHHWVKTESHNGSRSDALFADHFSFQDVRVLRPVEGLLSIHRTFETTIVACMLGDSSLLSSSIRVNF